MKWACTVDALTLPLPDMDSDAKLRSVWLSVSKVYLLYAHSPSFRHVLIYIIPRHAYSMSRACGIKKDGPEVGARGITLPRGK